MSSGRGTGRPCVGAHSPRVPAVRSCQVKLTRSLRPERWTAEAEGPGRDERTRLILAEAAALVAYGRSRAGADRRGRPLASGESRRHP